MPPPGTMRRTTRSTTGRGVTWSSPSSGRSRRTTGAQRRSRSQASAGDSSTSPRTRSRDTSPASIATRPPMLLPTTCASPIPARPSCRTPTARTSRRRRALRSACRTRRSPGGRSPRPGSGRRARRPSAGTTPSSRPGRGGTPPPPARRRPTAPRSGPTGVRSVSNASRPGSSDPLVAASSPTPRCRLPRMRRRPCWNAVIPPRTSCAIRCQVAASAAIVASGWPLSPAGTTRIRRDESRASHSRRPDVQPHHRAPARDVDHVRVVAARQRGDPRRRGLAVCHHDHPCPRD